MVKQQDQLDRTFSALADPTRRAILGRVAKGPLAMGELARPFGMTWPAVTKHVKALERAGLVRRFKEGRFHHIALHADPMRAASRWMDGYRNFWEQGFDRLERYLESTSTESKRGK